MYPAKRHRIKPYRVPIASLDKRGSRLQHIAFCPRWNIAQRTQHLRAGIDLIEPDYCIENLALERPPGKGEKLNTKHIGTNLFHRFGKPALTLTHHSLQITLLINRLNALCARAKGWQGNTRHLFIEIGLGIGRPPSMKNTSPVLTSSLTICRCENGAQRQ